MVFTRVSSFLNNYAAGVIMVCVVYPYSSKIFKRKKLFNILLFFGFTPVFTRSPILAMLFLREPFGALAINTLFVFHTPFSTHLSFTYRFTFRSTYCHYIIQLFIYKERVFVNHQNIT